MGILRSVPGAPLCPPVLDAGPAVSAEAVRGAATAAASRLVVVRKSLRLREFGSDFESIGSPLAVASIIRILSSAPPRLTRTHAFQHALGPDEKAAQSYTSDVDHEPVGAD